MDEGLPFFFVAGGFVALDTKKMWLKKRLNRKFKPKNVSSDNKEEEEEEEESIPLPPGILDSFQIQ